MGRVGIERMGNLGRKTAQAETQTGGYNVCLKNGQKLRLAEALSSFGRISI